MAELTPIYELRIGDGDTSDLTAHVVDGSSLEIRCTVSSNEIAEKPIIMLKKGQLVEAERSTMSATIKIPSFNYKDDGGMYECSTVLGEKKIRRRLRLMHKAVLPPGMTPCPDNDYCKNGGECGHMLDDLTKICVCPDGYVGSTCEDVLVRDFIGKSILTRTKVGVAAGGTCNVIFIFFLVVLGLLFFRERKRRRRVETYVRELNHQYNFESLPLVKDHLYAEDVYSQEVIVPPEKRSDSQSPVSNGKMMVRTNAVKKIITPGEEDESEQPHSS